MQNIAHLCTRDREQDLGERRVEKGKRTPLEARSEADMVPRWLSASWRMADSRSTHVRDLCSPLLECTKKGYRRVPSMASQL